MMYYLVPMKNQNDLGFGLVATSFLAAADELDGKKFSLWL